MGVVGVGALGRHHVRILSDLPDVDLRGVFDVQEERVEAAAREHGARGFPNLEALAAEVDAAVIAVPTVDHAAVGCQLLETGVDVLVEKPLAPSLAEADRLLEAAERRGRLLAVGHVEFYNPAVQALLGLGTEARFVEVHRLAVFSPRSLDVDVVLDLMIHDLQILHALDPSPVAEIRATGIAVLSPRTDITNVRLELESGCVCNLTASRVSSDRVRTLRVFSPHAYFSLDYQRQTVKGLRLERSERDRRIVREDLGIEKAEPLRRELEAFVRRCRGEEVPLVDGGQGRGALVTALGVIEEMSR
jgi:predicted dehydrogenase